MNCTSTGELCSPSEKLRFTLRRNGTLTSITYTTAATHCSAVLLHVRRNGHQVAKTGRLEAGERTERVTTHIALPNGVTRLGFKAQGFVGGCNAGQLGSWGGRITVTVKVRNDGEAEARAETLAVEVDRLRRSRERVFWPRPVEWIKERLSNFQQVLEHRTARSAQALRNIHGPIRMDVLTPDIGRPFSGLHRSAPSMS